MNNEILWPACDFVGYFYIILSRNAGEIQRNVREKEKWKHTGKSSAERAKKTVAFAIIRFFRRLSLDYCEKIHVLALTSLDFMV